MDNLTDTLDEQGERNGRSAIVTANRNTHESKRDHESANGIERTPMMSANELRESQIEVKSNDVKTDSANGNKDLEHTLIRTGVNS